MDQILVTPKSFMMSKTILINVIILILALMETQWGVLQPYLPGNVYAYFAFALPIINGVLRLVTTTPIKL